MEAAVGAAIRAPRRTAAAVARAAIAAAASALAAPLAAPAAAGDAAAGRPEAPRCCEGADLDLDDDDAGSEAAAREGLLALERGEAAAEMDVVDDFDDSWADVPPRRGSRRRGRQKAAVARAGATGDVAPGATAVPPGAPAAASVPAAAAAGPAGAFAPPADEGASAERAALVAELATLYSRPVDAALMALELDHLRTYVELVRMQKSK
ncbi:unnamed protein product [Prorocentrum cordatum]|uniref:Uncharacterized protein n=1 Tax=Prorocentrum cordatum TaxID=2364126 RepID=A0ABN9XX16_9DINO|nr:unnamed protein product [Polarella glacialis]